MLEQNSQNSFRTRKKNQFFAQTSVDDKWNVTAEVFFNQGPGSSQSIFGSDKKYWGQRMTTARGLIGVEGFPFQLSPLKKKNGIAISGCRFPRSCAEPCLSLQ